MNFDEYCKMGENADNFLLLNNFIEAEKEYLKIIKNLEKEKELDSFLICKSVLGLLLTYIKQKKIEKAYNIWLADPANNVFGLGIIGLGETFQTSFNDTILFYFCAAYLYTFANENPEEIADNVSFYMNSILQYAIENNKDLAQMAINNWKLHLMYIFDNFIPANYSNEITSFENKINKIIPIRKINFPKPSKWVIDWETNEKIIEPS